MAKISPVSIKYMIYATFEAEGVVEKPDVIGALFGQTEGLLGQDLEMRDLQKEGKIGRVEVRVESKNGKTIGKIDVPSALDKTETTLIGAAIETIERVGPSDAKIEVNKIEDVRKNKRDYILERAKKLLGDMDASTPKTGEIARNVKIGSRIDKVKEYGSEKLPAGDISGNEIIVVEGRADVINLVKNGVNNVIGMKGTKLPETVKELSYDKEVTLFLDGDRGGKLIAKNVIENARIDFVAVAPDGKEVEELTDKEILFALRKKLSVSDYSRNLNRYSSSRTSPDARTRKYTPRDEGSSDRKSEYTHKKKESIPVEKKKKELTSILNSIESSRDVVLLNKDLEQLKKTSTRSLSSEIYKLGDDVSSIVVGTVTKTVMEIAEKFKLANLIARNFSFTKETDVNLVSL